MAETLSLLPEPEFDYETLADQRTAARAWLHEDAWICRKLLFSVAEWLERVQYDLPRVNRLLSPREVEAIWRMVWNLP